MSQDTIVLIIVAVCAAIVVWGVVRRVRGRKGGCGCGCTDGSGSRSGGCSGCDGCSLSESCKDKK